MLGMRGTTFYRVYSGVIDPHSNFPTSVFVSVKKEKTVTIALDKEMSFSVLLHRVWKKHPTNVDFLGIYIPSTNKFSPKAHGLIGKVSADHLTSVGATLGREQLWVTLVRTWESDRGKLKSTGS